MNWTSILNDFPEEGSIVFVRIERKNSHFLCKFKNDSFGLGDEDFRVLEWRYAIPPKSENLGHPYYNLRSIQPVSDHIYACS